MKLIYYILHISNNTVFVNMSSLINDPIVTVAIIGDMNEFHMIHIILDDFF